MKQRIAIVGAGPVGLTAALCLARAGHQVRVFEKRAALSTASRASTFHAPTLDLLAALGVLAEVEPLGRRINAIDYYRCGAGRPDLSARFPLELLKGATPHPYRLHLEQSLLTPVLLRALAAHPGARVEFGAAVERIEAGREHVELEVRRADSVVRETFAWVVGADGARSTVRAAADIAFEGAEYEKRVLRVMTTLDLRSLIPGLAGISYLYNDDDSISLLEMRDVWRIIIRLPAGMSDEEALDPAFIRREVGRFLPIEGDLPARSIDIYATSQRIADRWRSGRVLLAGDAAHVTNTRGGMNMNAGLFDAWDLGRAFAQPHLERALDDYALGRRRMALKHLIPRTDRSVGGGSTYLAAIEATARDPALARAFVRDAAMLDIAPEFSPGPAPNPASNPASNPAPAPALDPAPDLAS